MTSASGAGSQPPARRDNGLRADQFVALADVDPRLGEHLLDLLRLAEIPAYLEPSTDPRVAVRYRVSGPVERLYVHADQRQEARAVVVAAAHEAGESADAIAANAPPSPPAPTAARAADVLEGIDTDAEFARIVAGFSGPAAGRPDGQDPINRHGIDPADLVLDRSSDVDEAPASGFAGDESDGDHPDGDDSYGDQAGVTPADLDAAAEARARDADGRDAAGRMHAGGIHAGGVTDETEWPDDEDDHFHPPPAPPIPVPTANTVSAVLLMILGILVLLRGDLFGLDSNTSFPASILLLLASSGLLIRGLRDRPDPEDGPEDDGAEV